MTSVIEMTYDDEVLCAEMHTTGRVLVTGGTAGGSFRSPHLPIYVWHHDISCENMEENEEQ